MITEILAPKTGLTAEEVTIVEWNKKEGDIVQKDCVLLTIETEKTVLEIESPRSGVLRKILVQEGDTVPVSQLIGYIADTMDEPISEKSPLKVIDTEYLEGEQESQQSSEVCNPVPRTEAGGRILAAPAARRLAREHCIELSCISGSGPNGRIQTSDVEKFLKTNDEVSRSSASNSPVSSIRKKIAEITLKSKTSIPHYYLFTSLDVTEFLSARRDYERSAGKKIAIDTILLRACGLALQKHPEMNVYWDQNNSRKHEKIRVGFAVDTQAGVIVPHIIEPQQKNLTQIDKELKELAQKAKEGRLSQTELSSGCLSISNLGMYPIDDFLPIILPGEVATLGIGRIKKTPIWVNGEFIPKDYMKLGVSFDHRIVDGAVGARFLRDFGELFSGKSVQTVFI